MHLGTVAEHIERIYRRAGSRKLWFVYMYHIPYGFFFHQFFFPNVLFIDHIWIIVYLRGSRGCGERVGRTALMAKLHSFTAAEDLVYSALKKTSSIFLLLNLKYRRLISYECCC